MFRQEVRDRLRIIENRATMLELSDERRRDREIREFVSINPITSKEQAIRQMIGDFQRLLDFLHVEIIDTPASRKVRVKEEGKG